MPVAQFWAGLSTEPMRFARRQAPEFLLQRIAGFTPVVAAAHYGIGGGTDTGQIRSNMFMNTTRRSFSNGSCASFALPDVPAGHTDDVLAHRPEHARFRPIRSLRCSIRPIRPSGRFKTDFVQQVPSLAAGDVNSIG